MQMDMWNELKKYRGKWVAIYKEKIIASGKSGKVVFDKAKKIAEKPIILQIPRKEEELCIL